MMAFKRLAIWRSGRAWGTFVCCVFLALQTSTGFFDTWERSFYDYARSHASVLRTEVAPIALIAIDDASLEKLGRWPWPLDIQAKLIDKLAQEKPRAIIVALPSAALHTDFSGDLMQKVKDLLERAAPAAPAATADSGETRQALAAILDELLVSAKDKAHWDHSVQAAGNVVVVPNGNLTAGSDIAESRRPSERLATAKQAFPTDSFADVLDGTTPTHQFANKVVLIGVTSPALLAVRDGSDHQAMSPLKELARSISSMLPTLDAQEPPRSNWFVFLITVLTGVYIAVWTAALPTSVSVGVGLVSAAGLLGMEFWLVANLDLWLKLVFPTFLLASGVALQFFHKIALRHSLKEQTVRSKAPEHADRMMGLALQGQGQLDMAFERFQHTPMNDTVAGDLYWLAIEYERQLRFDKAKEIYEYIARHIPDFKDVKARLSSANAATDHPQNSELPATPLNALSNDAALGQPKSLGRYRIEKPLGKGAMGAVYLGKDAKIGRQVALKTMALGQEFDGAELMDARDRFFREAKAAGRLQHPGIVTIFDVGEEGDLAFIAMEYVAGQDLQTFCKQGQLMPVPRVVSIVRRVAQALAYAHRHQVIHRDIKPSNVMYDLITDTVKVTDFGVARITDGNKTRTGVVLGSPSYMATEQLTGLTLDGRSDLYALGVMLFQLLTGVLPFRASSLAELMSKIANDPAPDIRQFRAELPEELARIVARLLEKLPENRYQDGEALDHALSSYAEHVQSRMTSPTTSALPRGEPDAPPILDLEL